MKSENLSDKRGSALGINALKIMLKIMGVNRTAEFIWVIAFFYALFDKKAGNAIMPYLKHRFPHDGEIKMFYHKWALFSSQGQSVLEAYASAENMISWEYDTPDTFSEVDRLEKNGIIILISHFGPWQALMSELNMSTRKVNFLVAPDQNINIDKRMVASKLKIDWGIISIAGEFGGLLEACNALENGEIVCIMGDRCYETEGIKIKFLDEKAIFPVAAFHLAARCGATIQTLFALRKKGHSKLYIHHGPLIRPKMNGRRRSALAPYLEVYVSELQSLTEKYPYQFYLFEDVWR